MHPSSDIVLGKTPRGQLDNMQELDMDKESVISTHLSTKFYTTKMDKKKKVRPLALYNQNEEVNCTLDAGN